MSRPTPNPHAEAVINLVALEHNVRSIAQLVAPAQLMFAVKANAYAHGLLPVATAGLAAGASSLAVLEIPAGLALRTAGVTAPLLAWLHGTETDFRAGIEADIELGISAVWQIEAIAASEANRPAVVHLKVDSGLSRNGATIEDWPELVRTALAAERAGVLRIRAAWSHLADASVADDEAALAAFLNAVAVAEALGARFELLHLAASSAGIRMPEARFGLVRIGIAAYGISPFDDRTGAELGLVPVMSLRAPVIETSVGGSRLARVAAGFADGVPTTGLEQASILVNGVRCPIASVEVDSLLVDTYGARVEVDDVAIIFGAGDEGEPTAEEWAEWAETIGDEIVTSVAPRVPRVYLR
jgi:alanine racemase